MPHSLAKMRRRIHPLRIEGPLYMLMLLLVSLLVQDHHSSARQVNGNLVLQQQQQSGSSGSGNNSLPALSERANVANSRYLSAASTASLAAATVAAAANGGSTQSVSSNNNNGNVNSQQADANRNFLTHQQLQQQQQQQQQQVAAQIAVNLPASSGASGAGSQLQASSQATNQAQQQQGNVQVISAGGQSVHNNQSPQFNSVQPQQVAQPVTSTYSFNSVTGQFVPSDLSGGSLSAQSPPNTGYNQQQFAPNQQQVALNSGLSSVNNNNNNNNINNNALLNQNQLPYGNSFVQQLQSQTKPFPGQFQLGFGFGQQPQIVSLPITGQYPYQGNQSPLGNLNLNQIINQQRQISQQQQQFNRRNGLGSAPSSSRITPVYGQQHNQQIEDDSGFLQQQQQLQSSSLLGGETVGAGGFGLDSAYGNLPTTSYLAGGANSHHQGHHSSINQQQQLPYNDQQQQHSISSQSSSVSATTVLPAPTISFGTAYTGSAVESFKGDQCVAADNRHGTCYQASECIRKGGTPMGKCGGNSNEFSGSSYVCCLFDVSCGQFAAERFVYFRNPNYPSTYDQSRMCRAKIGKLDKGVCQFRLDLLRFDVAKPTNGNCSNDMFVVSGQNENYIIPKICGLNDGQHYYVGVDESGVITLHMMMMGFYRRSFEILITQIPCRSDYAAPAHCLQYYMGTHGTIKSFNYDDGEQFSQGSTNFDLLQQANQQQQQQLDGNLVSLGGSPIAPYRLQFNSNGNGQLQQRQQQPALGSLAVASLSSPTRWAANAYSGQQQQQLNHFGGYPNDLDYTMCIRKESGFCSITYQLSRGDQGLQPFAVGQSLLFGANDSSWHSGSTECRDDYLLVGGVRLCSTSAFPSSGGYSDNSIGINSIQFAQNGSILGSTGAGPLLAGQQQQQLSTAQLQQQLQNQHTILLQQLARLQQQQQQQQQAAGNVTYANNGLNGNSGNNNSQQQQLQAGSNINNLEQQQAAILQQTMLIQQQLSLLANGNNNFVNQQDNSNRQFQQQFSEGQYSYLQGGTIITDTTSGPFILRFVSNMAKNARGFHIDYRQNPCK